MIHVLLVGNVSGPVTPVTTSLDGSFFLKYGFDDRVDLLVLPSWLCGGSVFYSSLLTGFVMIWI